MNAFIQFNGSNYGEVLNFVPSYVSSDGKTIRLYIPIPFEGNVEVHKGDYILNENGKIRVRK